MNSLYFSKVLLLCCLIFSCACSQQKAPNVLLIMSDDMGYSDLACYGGEINTPRLDELAHNGLRFTQFYNTARCCPTRASLLTGLHPHQAGVGEMTNAKEPEGYRGDLSSNAVTIAEVLKNAGFKTYMAGKWHVTKNVEADSPIYNWPLQRGFDRFYGTITGAGSFWDPVTLCRGNTFITPENDPDYQPGRFYYTNAISDNAEQFIREHYENEPDKPWFMYVAYTAAHWPMHALPEDILKYKGKYDAGYHPIREERLKRMKELGVLDPAIQLSEAIWSWEDRPEQEWESAMMEVYAAMIECMDRGIGQLVDQIEQQGDLDNTLILFLQDNGACAENWLNFFDPSVYDTIQYEALGRDGLQTRNGRPVIPGWTIQPGADNTYPLYDKGWANVSNTPFRFFKHFIHEGGISTPLIVHWPKGVELTGGITKQMGQLPDIMATIVDATDVVYPEIYAGNEIQAMEGTSLLPTFQGESMEHPPLFWEHIGKQGARVGDWKIVAVAGRVFPIPNDRWELYNIAVDRSELNDLAHEMPNKVAELDQLWEEWAVRCKVVPYN